MPYTWPTLLRPGDAGSPAGHVSMKAGGTYAGPSVEGNYADAIDFLRSLYPLGPNPVLWTPKLVAGNASYHSTTPWVPNDGSTNPGLGTGAIQTGKVWQVGKWVFGDAEVVFSPNPAAVNLTGIHTVISTDNFVTTAAHGLVAGMAVVLAGFVNTKFSGAGTAENGTTFYVAGTITSTTFQISRVDPRVATAANPVAVVDLTGTQDLAVTATATAPTAGVGFYRLAFPDGGDGVPLPATTRANANQAVVGGGQVFKGQGVSPLLPGVWVGVGLHAAPSVDPTVCGIVVNGGLPVSNVQGGVYALTHHTDDRTMDETAPGGSYSQAVATEGRNVLGTVINDLGVMLADNGLADFGASASPFATVGYNTSIYVWFQYETV